MEIKPGTIAMSRHGWGIKYFKDDIAKLDFDVGYLRSKMIEDVRLQLLPESGGKITQGEILTIDPKRRKIKKIHFYRGNHIIEFKNNDISSNKSEETV